MKTLLSTIALSCVCLSSTSAQEWKSGIEWKEPPVVTPGATNSGAPSDAKVLFGGRDLAAFEGGDQWLVQDAVSGHASNGY